MQVPKDQASRIDEQLDTLPKHLQEQGEALDVNVDLKARHCCLVDVGSAERQGSVMVQGNLREGLR